MNLILVSIELLLLILLLLGVAMYFYARAGRRAQIMQRTTREVKRQGQEHHSTRHTLQNTTTLFKQILKRLGEAVPLLNQAQRIEASNKLVAAGYRSTQALLILGGLSLLSVLLVLGLIAFYGYSFLQEGGPLYWLFALVLGIYIGSLLPRTILDVLVKRRQEAIRLALPDALDLMVITTNAGLALNASLDKVATEMAAIAPALADELKLTALQLRVSSDVEEVLNGLAKRTDLDAIRNLVNTLVQARQYGTAITQALRILAKSERTARMMSLEEQAAKLAVKITLPMMLFILPTVMIVAAGPAIMSMMETMSQM